MTGALRQTSPRPAARDWSLRPACAILAGMPPRHRPLLPALALLCACNGSQDETSGFGTPAPTTVPHTTGESSSSTGSSTSTSGDDSTSTSSTAASSTTLVLDMAMPDFGPQNPVGCEGKIDFLFVISTSGTMTEHQKQLAISFPGFLASIQEHFDDFDVHILSANPANYWSMYDCSYCADEECDPNASPPACGVNLDKCDKTIGAGIAFPAGNGSANRRCDFFGGQRYIIGDDPNFEASFDCMTQAGMNYASPATAEAMVEALSPELNGAGGCNEGFIRDDALLVVTILDDGYDVDSQGTIKSWIEALRAAKHGDEDAFAVLVLTTDVDIGYWQLCHPDLYIAEKNRLRVLVEGIAHGFIGSICEETYTSFFDGAVAEVVALCDDLVIPQ
jgi:hypothetical protein